MRPRAAGAEVVDVNTADERALRSIRGRELAELAHTYDVSKATISRLAA